MLAQGLGHRHPGSQHLAAPLRSGSARHLAVRRHRSHVALGQVGRSIPSASEYLSLFGQRFCERPTSAEPLPPPDADVQDGRVLDVRRLGQRSGHGAITPNPAARERTNHSTRHANVWWVVRATPRTARTLPTHRPMEPMMPPVSPVREASDASCAHTPARPRPRSRRPTRQRRRILVRRRRIDHVMVRGRHAPRGSWIAPHRPRWHRLAGHVEVERRASPMP